MIGSRGYRLPVLIVMALGCDAVDVSAPSAVPIVIPVLVTDSGFTPDSIVVLTLDTLAFTFSGTGHTVIWERQVGKTLPLDILAPISSGTILRPLTNSTGVFRFACGLHPEETAQVVTVQIRPPRQPTRVARADPHEGAPRPP